MKRFLISYFLIIGCLLCYSSTAFCQNNNDNEEQATVRVLAKKFLRHRNPTFRHKEYMPNVVWVSGIDTVIWRGKAKGKLCFFKTHKISRFFITPEDTIGSNWIRISYIEENGYLFFWYVQSKYLTQDVIDVLTNYGFCEFRTESHEFLIGENWVNDDSGGNIEYIFDLANPGKARRRVTRPFE